MLLSRVVYSSYAWVLSADIESALSLYAALTRSATLLIWWIRSNFTASRSCAFTCLPLPWSTGCIPYARCRLLICLRRQSLSSWYRPHAMISHCVQCVTRNATLSISWYSLLLKLTEWKYCSWAHCHCWDGPVPGRGGGFQATLCRHGAAGARCRMVLQRRMDRPFRYWLLSYAFYSSHLPNVHSDMLSRWYIWRYQCNVRL